LIFGKSKQILHHLTIIVHFKGFGKKNITHIFRWLALVVLKSLKIIFGIRFSLYICIVASESSSVGRAQPCQGWGREFESRLSLSCLGGGTGRHAGLKILFPLRECGFDSRPRYFKPLITHCYSRVFLFTGCKKGVKDNTKTEVDKYLLTSVL
jgi:hypothetical protein